MVKQKGAHNSCAEGSFEMPTNIHRDFIVTHAHYQHPIINKFNSYFFQCGRRFSHLGGMAYRHKHRLADGSRLKKDDSSLDFCLELFERSLIVSGKLPEMCPNHRPGIRVIRVRRAFETFLETRISPLL